MQQFDRQIIGVSSKAKIRRKDFFTVLCIQHDGVFFWPVHVRKSEYAWTCMNYCYIIVISVPLCWSLSLCLPTALHVREGDQRELQLQGKGHSCHERFELYIFVIRAEGYDSGIHCWEEEVGHKPNFCIGMARGSSLCAPKRGCTLELLLLGVMCRHISRDLSVLQEEAPENKSVFRLQETPSLRSCILCLGRTFAETSDILHVFLLLWHSSLVCHAPSSSSWLFMFGPGS